MIGSRIGKRNHTMLFAKGIAKPALVLGFAGAMAIGGTAPARRKSISTCQDCTFMSAGTGTGIIPLRLRHLIMVEDTTTAMAITAAERLTAVRRATRSRTASASLIAATEKYRPK